MSDLAVHALDAAELARLRTRDPAQRTNLYMLVQPICPDSIVYTMRVNIPVPISHDMVYDVPYNRDGLGPGNAIAWGDCLSDMTVFVGTSECAYDVGVARLRGFEVGSDENSGTMLIGEESEIDWTASYWYGDYYLTVVDDYNLWPRHIYIDPAGNIYMDHDVAYTDQNEYPDPVPVLGPSAVARLTGATVDVLFDGSDSWALDGGALTYVWSAPGASATANMNTATPTITYDAAGRYRVACTVSRNYGGGNIKTFTGYRYVHILGKIYEPITKFELMDCSGEYSTGGWSFRVRMWDEATRDDIVDRAKVILFAMDWYDAVEVSSGPIKSAVHGILRANIIAEGWIASEAITRDNEQGWVEFEVQGPQWWFDKMIAFPHGLEDSLGAPTDWFEFQDLTVDKGLWSWFHWRTTATRMMDVYATGDDRQIKQWAQPAESLWEQVTNAAENSILAHPCCDRYGRLFVSIPGNLIPEADRGTIPVVHQILTQDWREQVDIERRIVRECGMVDLSGVGYLDGDARSYFSLSFGHIFARYGGVTKLDRLALHMSQADNNELAGLVLGALNNDYPNVDIYLACNYRVVDICPTQYIRHALAAANTERGIVWNPFKNLLPRRVSFVYNNEEGVLLTDITCEGETFEFSSVDGDAPPTPPDPEPPDTPTPPAPPPNNYGGQLKKVILLTSQGVFITKNFHVPSPFWEASNNNLNANERTSIRDMAFDFADGHRAFMVNSHGVDGGAFRCNDVWGQAAWSRRFDNQYAVDTIDAAGGICTPLPMPAGRWGAIGCDPVTGDLAFIAGNETGGVGCRFHKRVFYSTDALATCPVGDGLWHDPCPPDCGHPNIEAGGRGIITSAGGALLLNFRCAWGFGSCFRRGVSVDGGITVDTQNGQLVGMPAHDHWGHTRVGNTVIFWYGDDAFFSGDAGVTFNPQLNILPPNIGAALYALSLHFLDTGNVMMAANGPWYSTDGGWTWGACGAAVANGYCCAACADPTFIPDGMGYVVGCSVPAANKWLYLTANLGTSWINKAGNLDDFLTAGVDSIHGVIPVQEAV